MTIIMPDSSFFGNWSWKERHMLGLALDANSSKAGTGGWRAFHRTSVRREEMQVTKDNGSCQATHLPVFPLKTTPNTKGKIKFQ